MANPAPRIVLLHATVLAMDPVRTAFAERWPEAEIVNLLDDSLSGDRAKDEAISPAMENRFVTLGRYAEALGADAILVTCSAFGPAVDAMVHAVSIPVLKPNEAMFQSAVSYGGHIGMVATFAPAIRTMEEEFNDYCAGTGARATLQTVLAEGALTALRDGAPEVHNRLVAEAAARLIDCDAIMLAQFSTSQAEPAVRSRVSQTVLASPRAAVDKVREMVGAAPSAAKARR